MTSPALQEHVYRLRTKPPMTSPPGELSAGTIASAFVDEFDLRGLDNPRFLPRNQFGQLIGSQPEVVEKIIRTHCPGRDVESLVDYSTENPRLFLTCVLSKKVSSIPSFHDSGFTDVNLPVEKVDGTLIVHSPRQKQTWVWDDFRNKDPWDPGRPWDWDEKSRFLEYQWLFSAITFKDDEFSFKISKKCPLPYIPLEHRPTNNDEGHLGEVYKVGLLVDHLETAPPRYLSLVNIPRRSGTVYQVAVKRLRIDGANSSDVQNYFNKAKGTLRAMKYSGHEHLIQAIAAYERGTEKTDNLKYFVFPWATGGNLRQFWHNKAHSMEGRASISWALYQIRGLADGLARLHEQKCRHGDIKPENILIFSTEGNSQTASAMGTLVLADVGIAKFHADNTSMRREQGYATTNKSGILRYEPPEIELRREKLLSRKIDVWSMGCVLLEFAIWLLHGSRGLDNFNNELLGTEPRLDRFWVAHEQNHPQTHPVAQSWIEKLRQSAGNSSILGVLLDLIETRLLVGLVESRADSEEMHNRLRDIEIKCRVNSPVYSFVPIPGAQQLKRPRRRYEEIERNYKCGWNGCEKAYATLNHLNAHVTMQSHGPKRILAGLGKRGEGNELAEIGPRSLGEHRQTTASPHDLTQAIECHNQIKTRWLLENFFDKIALEEYSWLKELAQLGLSLQEIADELLDKAMQGPWIHEPFENPVSVLSTPGFHQDNCVHAGQPTENEYGHPANLADSSYTQLHGRNLIVSGPGANVQDEQPSQPGSQGLRDSKGSPLRSIPESKGLFLTAPQRIEYFCGLGGVRPAADGSIRIELGSVSFEEDNSKAFISLESLEDNSTVLEVLDNLDRAAGELQQLGGCCDSFSVLLDSGSRNYVELYQVPFGTIRSLRELILDPDLTSSCLRFKSLFSYMFGGAGSMSDDPDGAGSLSHWVLLAAQFLALGLLSFAQAHCGPLRPFFLDTPLRSISLLGSGKSDQETPLTLTCNLVELTCLGEMVGHPVLAFDWLPSAITGEGPGMPLPPRKNVLASPADILDTWGPGYMAASADDSSVLYSVFVGGGVITSTTSTRRLPDSSATLQLHWSKQSVRSPTAGSTFPRNAKAFIGTTILENIACQSAATHLQQSLPMLEEIDTFPSYWKVTERQVGLGAQGGQAGVAILQFAQTWMRMPGVTKKTAILSRPARFLRDLDNMFGVQVSICTGIARRVRLRDLLADLLPAYVSGPGIDAGHWQELVETFNAPLELRSSDINQWLNSLDRPCRADFERLGFEVLDLLRNTGIDRKASHFVIAFMQPNSQVQCFKIPCKDENSWARMLMDSEDNATFAYVTTQCLETAAIRCRGPWSRSTALMGTAVSQDWVGAGQWTLRENEAYLIGHPDKELYVKVERPSGLDPHLLVSRSAIPPDFLRRLIRRGKLKRLREKKWFDNRAESVVICTQGCIDTN